MSNDIVTEIKEALGQILDEKCKDHPAQALFTWRDETEVEGDYEPITITEPPVVEEPIHPVVMVDTDLTTCQLCPLWEHSTAVDGTRTTRRSGILGRGTGRNGLMIVAEAPGAQEVLYGAPLVGPSGKLLSEYLRTIGIVEEDCWITNVVRCRPTGNRDPSVTEARTCQTHHLAADLPSPEWRPKILLMLGKISLKYFLNMQKLGSRRGILYDTDFLGTPIKAMATYHPAKLLRTAEAGVVFKEDLHKIQQFLLGQKPDALPPFHRSQIRTVENFRQWMTFFAGLPPEQEISIDLETTGLEYQSDTIVSIAFTTRYEGRYYGCAFLTFAEVHTELHNAPILTEIERLEQDFAMTVSPEERELVMTKVDGLCGALEEPYWYLDLTNRTSDDYLRVKSIIETHRGVYFSGDFDTKFLWKVGILAENFFDVMDAHLMVEEEKGTHSLQYSVVKYLGEAANYKHQFRETLGENALYHEAPPETLLTYNGDDTFYTKLLAQRFTAEMVEEEMHDFFWELAMPLQRTLTQVTWRGIRANAGYIRDLAQRYRGTVRLKQEELFDTVGRRFNQASIPQLVKLLYKDLGLPVLQVTKKKGAPSTDKKALKELAAHHPVPKLILELRKLARVCATLDGDDGLEREPGKDKKQTSVGLLGFIDATGRIHTHLLPHGTTSGRLSSSEPNLQNIPKTKEFRDIFYAAEGWKLIDADYVTAEMTLLAYLCEDEALQRACRTGDVHANTYRELHGYSADVEVPADIRNTMKSVNFRKIYRGGYQALAKQLGMSEEECKQWYDRWNRAFPGVEWWWSEQDRRWLQDGAIVSIFGRKRRFPVEHLQYQYSAEPYLFRKNKAYFDRLAVNFPCQAGVGDATNRAMVLMDQELKRVYGWHPDTCWEIPGILLTVHDELLLECREDDVPKVSEMLRLVMTLPLPGINVPLDIDLEVKQTWGEGIIVKKAEEKAALEEEDEDLITT